MISRKAENKQLLLQNKEFENPDSLFKMRTPSDNFPFVDGGQAPLKKDSDLENSIVSNTMVTNDTEMLPEEIKKE